MAGAKAVGGIGEFGSLVMVGMGGSVQDAQGVLFVGIGGDQRLGAEMLGHGDGSRARWQLMKVGQGGMHMGTGYDVCGR